MIRAVIDGRTIGIHYARSGAISRVVDEDTGEKLQVLLSTGAGRTVRIGDRDVPIREIEEGANAGVVARPLGLP